MIKNGEKCSTDLRVGLQGMTFKFFASCPKVAFAITWDNLGVKSPYSSKFLVVPDNRASPGLYKFHPNISTTFTLFLLGPSTLRICYI